MKDLKAQHFLYRIRKNRSILLPVSLGSAIVFHG